MRAMKAKLQARRGFQKEVRMSVKSLVGSYHETFGAAGAFALLCYCVVGIPEIFKAFPKGSRRPVYVRVGTSDAWLYREILIRGQYALDLPFLPKTIVDAGANIGLASIYLAHKYPQARVIAVEAEMSNFELLSKNVAPYPNIVPIHAALWNRDGFISIAKPDRRESCKWGFVAQEGPGVKVRAVTMPTLMREHGLEWIDFLKVDIEGSEKELFEDHSWAEDVRCLAIELHDHFKPGCSAAVNAALSNFSRSRRGEVNFYVHRERSVGVA
jgi:FkbM family methyltransferase